MKKSVLFLLSLTPFSYCEAHKEIIMSKRSKTEMNIAHDTFYLNEKIELNLIKGETYRQNITTDMSMVQTMGDQEINIKMGIIGKMAYKVLNVLDTTYEIEVKYEGLAMKMDMPTGAITIDSEKESTGDVFSKVLAAMKKNPFQITISRSGKIIAVRNIENLFNAFDEFPELPAAQKEQLKKQLSESYGEKAFKGNLGMSMTIFPKRSVSLGESWTVKGKLESGMEAELETIYELKEIGTDYYLLAGTAKITTTNNENYVERNGMQVKSNLNGTMTTEIKINKKTGWLISSKTTQQIKGTTSIKANEQLPDGMTLPLKMTSVITGIGQ